MTFSADRSGRSGSWPNGPPDTDARKTVPLMLDADGKPLKRNFFHWTLWWSISSARFNPASQHKHSRLHVRPVDYASGQPISINARLPTVKWRPISIQPGWTTRKGKFCLDWRPLYLPRLVDSAGTTSARPGVPV